MNRKYVFITGGVLSGLGKGIVSSSISLLLQSRGYNVSPIKIDGYLNVDAGTMNPIEHGEVFVLDDGTECDMDLGNYERFLNKNLRNGNSLTNGKIFEKVLKKERAGEYLGKTVQVIPHVTQEIKDWIKNVGDEDKADIMVIEVGGTVGDIESQTFLEALRQLSTEVNRDDYVFIHLSLVPVLDVVGEQKTKPTQHTVKELRSFGINADIIVGRSNDVLNERTKEKIRLQCGVKHVISDPDLDNIYEAPLVLEREGLIDAIEEILNLEKKKPDMKEWIEFVDRYKENKNKKSINIAITGKYTDLEDSYVSIKESLIHASTVLGARVELKYVDTTGLKYEKVSELLKGVDGVIVPGGFGSRGIEGKINTIRYCRENNIPFLGLCYGMQLAVIEFARNVAGMKNAHTTEVDKNTPYPVIHIMDEQKKIKDKGGTMRLGAYPAVLKKGTKVYNLYGREKVSERHRHRYEVNPEYIKVMEEKGLVFSGKSPDGKLMEFLEIPNHKYFVATQAHPELKSRPLNPHPLFVGFVEACMK